MARTKKQLFEVVDANGNAVRVEGVAIESAAPVKKSSAPKKYESGEIYKSPKGNSYTYDKTVVDRNNAWTKANNDQFNLNLPVGYKAVANYMADLDSVAVKVLFTTLLEQEIERRIASGEYSQDVIQGILDAYTQGNKDKDTFIAKKNDGKSVDDPTYMRRTNTDDTAEISKLKKQYQQIVANAASETTAKPKEETASVLKASEDDVLHAVKAALGKPKKYVVTLEDGVTRVSLQDPKKFASKIVIGKGKRSKITKADIAIAAREG